jgi:hypothetical protein
MEAAADASSGFKLAATSALAKASLVAAKDGSDSPDADE